MDGNNICSFPLGDKCTSSHRVFEITENVHKGFIKKLHLGVDIFTVKGFFPIKGFDSQVYGINISLGASPALFWFWIWPPFNKYLLICRVTSRYVLYETYSESCLLSQIQTYSGIFTSYSDTFNHIVTYLELCVTLAYSESAISQSIETDSQETWSF